LSELALYTDTSCASEADTDIEVSRTSIAAQDAKVSIETIASAKAIIFLVIFLSPFSQS
jgi:hypothetical protein